MEMAIEWNNNNNKMNEYRALVSNSSTHKMVTIKINDCYFMIDCFFFHLKIDYKLLSHQFIKFNVIQNKTKK